MTEKIKLSTLQKRRLAGASQEALSKRQTWHLARITQAPEGRLEQFRDEMLTAELQFESLLLRRGLCVGDPVRITVDGPFKDAVSVIESTETDGRLYLRLENQSVLPFAHEVELVAEQNYNQRSDKRRKA